MGNPIFSEHIEHVAPKNRTYAQICQQQPPDEHPIRFLLSRDTNIPSRPEPDLYDPVDDLEEMIIRQLRPRNISLLFGNSSEFDPETVLSMDTVMTRLRRQVRNSTIRLIQERPDARDRLEMDRMMRRVRQERRNDQSLYRWQRGEEEEEQEMISQRNRRRNEQYERQILSIMQARNNNNNDSVR
jgi:hypothetical protein